VPSLKKRRVKQQMSDVLRRLAFRLKLMLSRRSATTLTFDERTLICLHGFDTCCNTSQRCSTAT
jgi:hypothetical protein